MAVCSCSCCSCLRLDPLILIAANYFNTTFFLKSTTVKDKSNRHPARPLLEICCTKKESHWHWWETHDLVFIWSDTKRHGQSLLLLLSQVSINAAFAQQEQFLTPPSTLSIGRLLWAWGSKSIGSFWAYTVSSLLYEENKQKIPTYSPFCYSCTQSTPVTIQHQLRIRAPDQRGITQVFGEPYLFPITLLKLTPLVITQQNN